MRPRLLAALAFGCAGLGAAGPVEAQPAVRTPAPLVFDAGAEPAPGFRALRASDRYARAGEYGWEAPAVPFARGDVGTFRPALLRDGVAARRLAFRADVPDGAWWATLYVEAGREDSSTSTVTVNGVRRSFAHQPFVTPAEPRVALQKLYRVLHLPVRVTAGHVRLELDGVGDTARVLALALRPDPRARTARHRAWEREIARVGRFDAADSLGPLRTALGAAGHGSGGTGDPFAAYWHEQVGWLADAEEFIRLRGWGWATARQRAGIFDRYHQAVALLDGILHQPDAARHPLHDRARLARLRLLYWLWQEQGGAPERRGALRDVAILRARHPSDPLLRMYAGERVDTPDACDALAPTPGAPEWSTLQRETLCRLRGVAHWWVNEQQETTGPSAGEFGGKLDDDVELLRWWVALIAAGDTTALRGWTRLADGVWHGDWLQDGYSKRAIDVEHASELIADTAPLLTLFADDPAYVDRLRPSARHFERLWTGRTAEGHRRFRAAWFSSTEVDARPPRDRDVPYNTRAAKALRYLAWRAGDAHVAGLLDEWTRAWLAAAERTDKGKPPGLFPASIRFSDGAFNGDEPTWHRANMFWDYFDWDGGGMMLDHAFFLYTLRGDTTLLRPLHAALDLVAAHEADPGGADVLPGSAAWAARVLREDGGLWRTAAQWRLHTGDARHDRLLAAHGTPYLRYRLTGDERPLRDALQPILDNVRTNTPLLTSEVLHTDRVYVTRGRDAGAEDLKAMLTGDMAGESASPYYAVTWTGTDADFTVLVADAGPGRLHVRAFHHGAAGGRATMRLWGLAPGRYALRVGGAAPVALVVTAKGQRVPLALPPRALLDVRIAPAP